MVLRVTALAALAFAAVSAFAQAPIADPAATPRIDGRQANQQARINQGVRTGELTPKEASRLQAQQDQIAAQKAAAKADGVVTAKERKQLKAGQKQASRRIHKQKHDPQRTVPAA